MSITRRQFMWQSGMLSAALALPSLGMSQTKSKFKLGLQLYSVREELEKDLTGTLKKLAGYGYQEVETYGFNYGNNKYYWGLEPKDARALLNDSNLSTSAGHYDLDKFFAKNQTDALKSYVDECIAGAHIMGQDYIVWPWLAPEYRNPEEFKRLAETLNRIGEQIKKGKLQLAYHNHDFEFISQDNKTGYDILLNETDPDLVKMEVDLYWLSHTSVLSPLDWFKKQPGRFVLWHVKDMDKKDRELHVPLGRGQIDYVNILNEHRVAGLKHLFVEQGNNYQPNVLTCMKQSADYLKPLLPSI